MSEESHGRTARLEFRMVDQTATPEMLQQNRPPIGAVILPTAEGGRIAVQRRAMISGEQIADARQDYDQQDGTPNVVITFDSTGGRRFARITQENVGRPFAIVGSDPDYSSIRHPPLHPSCQCAMVEVLKPEYGGPEAPDWAATLDQPRPGPDYQPPEGVAEPEPDPARLPR